jgi:hypothetical protein
MSNHRFRVPTHLLVEGTMFSLNLGLFALRLSWRQLAWLLGAIAIAAYPCLALGWPLLSLPLIGLPLVAMALGGAFIRPNGLTLDRWLLLRATYAWSRPRLAHWQPAAERPVLATTPPGWQPYRPARLYRRPAGGD